MMPEPTPLHTPGHFGDPEAEYWQARERAAVFDVSNRGKIELRGPDAKTFLHNLCSNNILALAPGDGCEAFLATAKAKLVAHIFIYLQQPSDGEPSLWLDVAPGLAEKVVKHLDRYLISEQVEILDRTDDFDQLHLAGPLAEAVLPAGAGFAQVRRHDVLGLPGYDILVPAGQAEAAWQALLNAGARPAGRDAYEWLRIEAGTPW
jgi:glycine cleavage system aminomethyltransferase T